MLEVKEGKIYVEGVETNDHELIALAFKDFAEGIYKRNFNSKFHVNEELNIVEFTSISYQSSDYLN